MSIGIFFILLIMKLLLKRIAKKPKYTIGKFYIDGAYVCDSIEDTDRGLSSSMSEEDVKKKKVYGETAIPTGTYTVTYTYSNKFKKMMPAINNVKGFSGIRIHSGNTEKDSLGCIILGQNKEVGKVLNSRVTCDKVYAMISQAIKKGESVTITIQ